MTDERDHEVPTLQRLVAMFRGAMADLGKSPSEAELERWAVLVHASMSGRGRSYHTVEHVFDVTRARDAIGTLAALFHDTVYCEVDGGLPRELEQALGDALRWDGVHAMLQPFDPRADTLRALVVRIFGRTPGQSVTPRSGLNELASALLAARALSGHLSTRELAEVVACIEATIPFRPSSAEEDLAQRLAEVDAEHRLGLDAAGVEAAVSRAVQIANDDVANFAYEDTADFLSNTWDLLPEANPTLRLPAYTIGEYRAAMARMAGFLGALAPERVFRTFQGSPQADELEDLRDRARRNLSRASRYLRQKLLGARLLEALAKATGGDAPVSLFTGDLPSAGTLRLEQLLPRPTSLVVPDVAEDVLRLLVEGRRREAAFDLRNSPVAAFLYARLGDAASDRVLAITEDDALLEALPQALVAEVAGACARLAVTRRRELEGLAARSRARG
jgi:hypothetical protein